MTAHGEATPTSFSKAKALLASRAFWFLLLLVLAVAHFASYWRHGLNFRDEGGTVALVAQRLLAGERPFVDVSLGGYNVLWFWPVVLLFKLTGVSFIALRAYCFALSTIAALLVFWIVERAGRKPWLAFLVALLAVLVPGMTFKNYMPFLAVANAAALLGYTLAPPDSRERWLRLRLGALLLGATWLIRVDLGIFATALWFGAVILSSLHAGVRSRMRSVFGGLALLVAVIVAWQIPFLAHARSRGYASPFLAQYTLWPRMMMVEWELHFHSRPAAPAKPLATPAPAAKELTESVTAAPAKAPAAGRETLRRKGWRDILSAEKPEQRQLAALLYLPLLTLVPLVICAIVSWLRAVSRRDENAASRALAALLVLGAALAVFPQYFFFRPDSPHLSEFSPCFWAAVAAAPLLLGFRGWVGRVFAVVIVLHAGLFLWRMWPDRWAGTIWARDNRQTPFDAENGVRVFVTKREQQSLVEMLKVIRAHSKPGEYLVAYPYHPAINVLANRPTYERDVYVDNATRTSRWEDEAIARIEKFRPAVIVLSEWDVNGTEASRFSAWAPRAKAWIEQNYEAAGVFQVSSDKFAVFTRK